MKCDLTGLIPRQAKIEIEDIGYLFYRYIMQSSVDTPHSAARAWLERMNDVCLEEWGGNLQLEGVLGLRQVKQEGV